MGWHAFNVGESGYQQSRVCRRNKGLMAKRWVAGENVGLGLIGRIRDKKDAD